MDNREKLELLRQTVLAAAQRSAEETEAETKKIIEDTVSAEKKRLSDEIAEIKSMSYDELRSRDEKELVTKDAKLRKNILVKRGGIYAGTLLRIGEPGLRHSASPTVTESI